MGLNLDYTRDPRLFYLLAVKAADSGDFEPLVEVARC